MANKTVPPGVQKLVLNIIRERDGKLIALAQSIERMLGESCNEGANPPDGAPLSEWRLAQVMKDLLVSSDTEQTIEHCLKPYALTKCFDQEIRQRVLPIAVAASNKRSDVCVNHDGATVVVNFSGLVAGNCLENLPYQALTQTDPPTRFGVLLDFTSCILLIDDAALAALLTSHQYLGFACPVAVVASSQYLRFEQFEHAIAGTGRFGRVFLTQAAARPWLAEKQYLHRSLLPPARAHGSGKLPLARMPNPWRK